MNEREREVIGRLLGRRDPSARLLLEVERMGDVALQELCGMLKSGSLSAKQQSRALQGLAYATKHAGYAEHQKVLEVALERVLSRDIALRSRAVHTAICTASILERLVVRDASEDSAPTSARSAVQRVAEAARAAAKLGLHPPTDQAVHDFLSRVEV